MLGHAAVGKVIESGCHALGVTHTHWIVTAVLTEDATALTGRRRAFERLCKVQMPLGATLEGVRLGGCRR